jgi:hypothetical protein
MSALTSTFLLTWPVLHFCPSLFKLIGQRGFTICVADEHTVLYQINPSSALCLLFHSRPNIPQFLVCFITPSSYTRCVFQYHSFTLHRSPSLPSPLKQSLNCKNALPTYIGMIMFVFAHRFTYWIYLPHRKENMRPCLSELGLLDNMVISSSIHLPANGIICFSLWLSNISFIYVYICMQISPSSVVGNLRIWWQLF